jgi:hypothetical protein
LGLALVLNVALLAFWIGAVSASWVKRSALLYASRYLEGIDGL